VQWQCEPTIRDPIGLLEPIRLYECDAIGVKDGTERTTLHRGSDL